MWHKIDGWLQSTSGPILITSWQSHAYKNEQAAYDETGGESHITVTYG
jgi:hypothetical protein